MVGSCRSPCACLGRDYTTANLSVNLYTVNEPWLFSILWCAGVPSVTSDSSHVLRKVPSPIWLMVSTPWEPLAGGNALGGCRGESFSREVWLGLESFV